MTQLRLTSREKAKALDLILREKKNKIAISFAHEIYYFRICIDEIKVNAKVIVKRNRKVEILFLCKFSEALYELEFTVLQKTAKTFNTTM